MKRFFVSLILVAVTLIFSATAVSQAVPYASFSLTDAIKSYASAFGDTIPPAFFHFEFSAIPTEDAIFIDETHENSIPARWIQPWNATIFPYLDKPRRLNFESHPIHGYCFGSPTMKFLPYDEWPYSQKFVADSAVLVWNDPSVTGAIVSVKPIYILRAHTTTDPRLSAWWLRHVTDSTARDLWNAVERSACTERYPGITFSIFSHMIETGIVSEKTAYDPHPTRSDIQKAMVEYTQAGLVRNFYLVRNVLMGNEPLTEENFKTLQVGDTVADYRMPNFGPVSTPLIYPIVRVDTVPYGANFDAGPRVRNWFFATSAFVLSVDGKCREYWDNTDELKYETFAGNPFVAIHRKKK